MADYVIDANVAVKWFTPEDWSESARRLLNRGHTFAAPDFLPTEVMNAMLRKLRKGEVERAHVALVRQEVRGVFELVSSEQLLDRAVEISLANQRDAFDSVYVALALERGCQFVTADGPLCRALARPFPGTLLWIEDVPA